MSFSRASPRSARTGTLRPAIGAPPALIIVVDAANVAYANAFPGQQKQYEADLLLAAYDALHNWAKNNGPPIPADKIQISIVIRQVALDDLARRQDPAVLELLERDKKLFVRAPSRSDDDEMVLVTARDAREKYGRTGTVVRILSNDNYDRYREDGGGKGAGSSHVVGGKGAASSGSEDKRIEGVNGAFLSEVLWKFSVVRDEIKLVPMPGVGAGVLLAGGGTGEDAMEDDESDLSSLVSGVSQGRLAPFGGAVGVSEHGHQGGSDAAAQQHQQQLQRQLQQKKAELQDLLQRQLQQKKNELAGLQRVASVDGRTIPGLFTSSSSSIPGPPPAGGVSPPVGDPPPAGSRPPPPA